MREKFILQYRDKRYSVERGRPAGAAAAGGGAPGRPDRWYITLGGAVITSLEHHPAETEVSLRERIYQWLAAHADLQSRDQIHLRGG